MSLVATRFEALRINNPQLDRNMTRPSEYGALDMFVRQTDAPNSIISPNLRDRAFRSIGNTVQVPVINYDGTVTVSTTRTCVIADDENTSALYTVNFATYAVGFTMVPTLYLNNEISYDHDFARKMEKITYALLDKLDTDAITALSTNKSQVFNELLYYTESGDVIQVPWDMRTDILGDLNPMMRANDYRRTIHLLGNAGIDSIIRKLAQHGLYNDVNKRMEYDNKVIYYSNNLTNESGKFATGYAVEEGSLGILTRVDREALVNGRAAGHEWGVTTLPLLDLPVGYHYYVDVGDQSSIAGDASADITCARKEHYGFSLDVAYVVAYNDTPASIANPIFKFEIAKSDANPAAQPVVITNSETNPVNTKEVGAGA